MQWRRLLMSGGAALSGVAAYNLLARRTVSTLPNFLGGEEAEFEWRGHRIAYTMHGQGAPLLLVHSVGISDWSFEWRYNVDALALNYRVYALDLLGFGRSERPQTSYTARLYLALLGDFARRVIRSPTGLAAAGLSGAYAVELAAADPGRFPIVVLVAPTGITRLRVRASRTDGAGRRLVGTPVLGTAAFNARTSHGALRRMLEELYCREEQVTDELIEVAYATTHQPGAKHAPSALLANQLHVDIRGALRRLRQPTLLVWGAQAARNPVEESFGYRAVKHDMQVAILDPAGDYPHDERPEEFNDVVRHFLATS